MKDHEIVSLLKSNHPDGLKQLLKEYRPFFYYIITPILPNEQDREDCILEISTRIWEKIHLYDEEKGNFLSWLTSFTKNTALNYYKKNKKHGHWEELTETIPDKFPTPEDYIIKKERQEKLLQAINRLSHSDKLLFYRKYYYMQSTAQIALEYGTYVRAIEGKLYRIKKQLRKFLGGDFYE